jgi:formate dehydrogenase major subunit
VPLLRGRSVGSANGRLQRLAMAKLDWLVVRDFSLIESATWWKDGPEIESGELRTADIGTEVFFLPAAAHTEKAGSFTNTQRMLQWHHPAVEPPGPPKREHWARSACPWWAWCTTSAGPPGS